MLGVSLAQPGNRHKKGRVRHHGHHHGKRAAEPGHGHKRVHHVRHHHGHHRGKRAAEPGYGKRAAEPGHRHGHKRVHHVRHHHG